MFDTNYTKTVVIVYHRQRIESSPIEPIPMPLKNVSVLF